MLSRRAFNAGAIAALAAATAPDGATGAVGTQSDGRCVCVFIKFLNGLTYDQLAEEVAAIGFTGVEATVRSNGGYILPQDAPRRLPELKRALEKHGLGLDIITTDILSADQQYADDVVRAAADAGAPFYRLGFHRYDLQKPIVDQIAGLKPKFDAIAKLNRQAGISAVYQNHAGPEFVGATIWDLHSLLKDIPPSEIGCVYDLRHAAVEAGRSWPTLYSVMKQHVTAYSVKDYAWRGRSDRHVPLGEGLIDPEFYRRLGKSDFSGPISLHVEYLPKGAPAEQLQAVARDVGVLKGWLE